MTATPTDDVDSLDAAERTALAERAEAQFMDAFEGGAPVEVQEALGMSRHRIGGGVALVMARDPTGGYWNKALGFGIDEPFTGDVAAEVVDAYRAGGSRVAVLQVAPSVLPENWEDVCGRLGIVAGSVWVKLLRPTRLDPPEASSDLRVGEVGPEDAEAWGRVLAVGFGMPQVPSLLAMFGAATRADSGFRPWAAWDGDRLVASANLHVGGPAAAFCGAATLPEARRRGAQSVFVQRRVELAGALGAEWCSAETWREEPTHDDPAMHHNPSLHTMRRAGFVDAYERTNWIWHAPS